MAQKVKKQIEYLLKITDKIGVIEHCIFNKPNYYEGYSTDDNARALQVCLRFGKEYPILEKVLPVYFNFLKSAFRKGFYYSDLNEDFTWRDNFEINGEHCGRALVALGEVIKFRPYLNVEAKNTFDQIYNSFSEKKSPHCRVLAQIILGLKFYHQEDISIWADLLLHQYLKEKNNDWKWFEEIISYDIGRMPLALLVAYQVANNTHYLHTALESLDFLTEVIFNQKYNCFVFPGNKGWFTKSGNRTIFDQQPIEAGSMTEVYSLAFLITKKKKYKDLASKAFAWYTGKNILKVNLINPKTGGIHDGFNEKEINLNQGSESVLSYLLAYSAK